MGNKLNENIDKTKAEFLKSKGWFQWYHPDYWVNTKYVPEGRDYGYYGFTTEEAYLKALKEGE